MSSNLVIIQKVLFPTVDVAALLDALELLDYLMGLH